MLRESAFLRLESLRLADKLTDFQDCLFVLVRGGIRIFAQFLLKITSVSLIDFKSIIWNFSWPLS